MNNPARGKNPGSEDAKKSNPGAGRGRVAVKKKFEKDLAENETRFRNIFLSSPSPLVLADPQGRVVEVNRAVYELFGIVNEAGLKELNLLNYLQLTEANQTALRAHRTLRLEGTYDPATFQGNRVFKPFQAGPLQLEVVVSLVPWLPDNPGDGYLVQIQDMTDRKNAEDALCQSEEKYRTIFEHSGTALLICNEDFSLSLINRELENLCGYTSMELLGSGQWVQIIFPEDLAKMKVYHQQRRLDPDSAPRDYEIRFRHKNGQERTALFSGTLIPSTRQTLGALVDITERKAAEKQLQESERRYRLLADNIHDVIWMADSNQRLTFITPSVTRLRGFTVDEALSQSLEQAFTPESIQRLRAWNDAVKADPSKNDWARPLELEQTRRDGSTVWTEVHISPMLNPQGLIQGYVGMSRDISARRQAEAEQRRLEEQLRQSQKMEIIGHLAGGIAHDFNNLLTPILGYADMAASQVPAGVPLANDIRAIQETAERAARLTRQLLAFSLKQVLHMTTVQLNREITDFIKMLHSLIGEHILVSTELAPDLGCITADLTQIQQVLLNLAVNARDAMPRGGTLTLSTANVEVDESLIKKHPALHAGPHVRLTVADTGLGMTPEILGHIFDPFFTTKEHGKGTGLGLSMVYGIVTQHHGAIIAESEPRKGAVFHLFFPKVEANVSLAEAAGSPEEKRGGHETILVVEDEPMVRKLAQEILTGQGYTVLEASDPLHALEYLRQYAGSFDLLLTDIVMPGMNGKELYQHLSQERPGLKVLYMSGYSEDVIAHQGVLDPGTELLAKPFALKALLAKVRSVLDQHPPGTVAP